MGPCNYARAVRKEREPNIAGIGSPPAASAAAVGQLASRQSMPVYFVQEASGVGKAVFRPTESAEDVFLCSIDLTAYSEPRVRDLFTELVTTVADFYRRAHVAEAVDPAAWVAELPCANCTSPEAADVLHRARQAASISELGVTGSYVTGCCKSRVVGVIGGRPDTSRPVARR